MQEIIVQLKWLTHKYLLYFSVLLPVSHYLCALCPHNHGFLETLISSDMKNQNNLISILKTKNCHKEYYDGVGRAYLRVDRQKRSQLKIKEENKHLLLVAKCIINREHFLVFRIQNSGNYIPIFLFLTRSSSSCFQLSLLLIIACIYPLLLLFIGDHGVIIQLVYCQQLFIEVESAGSKFLKRLKIKACQLTICIAPILLNNINSAIFYL